MPIPNADGETMLVKGEDIIVITADGTGGLPRSGNLDAVQLWYGPGLQLLLNLAGRAPAPVFGRRRPQPEVHFQAVGCGI